MLEEQQGLLPEPSQHKRRGARWGFPRFRASLSFILIAVFSGILFYLLVFSVVLSKPSLRATGRKYIFGDDQEPYWPRPPSFHDEFEYGYDEEHAITSLAEFSHANAPPSATPTLASEDGLLELSVDDLKAMVGRTKGYFVRDWSLALGWNNMRYIIEAAVLQAELLNRTLIIPSRVYARACEYHNDVCARYSRMVNRNDALYTNEWRNLPIEKQMGFELPIEIMLDIPHLRQKHNVMLMSEYLHVQGLNITREKSNGGWDRAYYHQGIDRPTLFVIPNNIYDPETVARVDIMPPAPLLDDGSLNATVAHFESTNWLPDDQFGRDCNNRLLESLKDKHRAHLEWAEAVQALRGASIDVTNDSAIERALKSAGWVVLHTFEGALGMEYIKSVVNPIKHVARYPSLRGLKDDFRHVNQDVLLLEGEVHLGRKPGSVRFTTPEARDRFANIVLKDVIPPPRVKELALRIIKRMNDLNKNHLWLAGHMRRGDFVNVGWAMEGTIKHHLDRILQRLSAGRQILERIRLVPPQPYRVPGVRSNGFTDRTTPVNGDYIYMATDERSDEALQLFKESHIKIFSDLVTIDDRRQFGWPLLFSDVIALVEQQVIGLGAGYFYAHAMSSVAGGILNIRAASGCDSRTALLD